MVIWIIPGIRRVTRLASFTFFFGQFYLTTYVSFPVPWYIPTLTLFSFLVISGVVSQLMDFCEGEVAQAWLGAGAKIARDTIIAACCLLIIGSLSVTLAAAHQLRLQQTIIEHGQRREIGRWLRSHAARSDTVFLEPLGYIGFYSNLKMLDYPGLSSPEVVAARRRANSHAYPDCWAELIIDLSPGWLVLRSYEADVVRKQAPGLLNGVYTLAKTFDVRPQIEAINSIEGRGYLLNDALFEVYQRNPNLSRNGAHVARVQPIRAASLQLNEAWNGSAAESGLNILAHAPSRLRFERLASARWLSGSLGFQEGAYTKPASSTDGASFRIYFISGDGARQELFRRDLNPRDQPGDRGPQSFSVDLPGDQSGMIELEISPGPNGSNAFDWTYWSVLLFEIPSGN